jgi:hypothetical protein
MTHRPRNSNGYATRDLLIGWLLLVTVSFLVGGAVMATIPSVAGTTFGIGFCTNVAMAVAMGVLIGWTGRLNLLPLSVVCGSAVTLLGLDELGFITPGYLVSLTASNVIPFDLFGYFFATIGMSILIGLGVILGAVAHPLQSRCSCVKYLGDALRWRLASAGSKARSASSALAV